MLKLFSCFEQTQLQEKESNLCMKEKKKLNFVFRKQWCAKSSISLFLSPLYALYCC